MKKLFRLLFLLAVGAVPAWGQGAGYTGTVLGPTGAPKVGASISVCSAPANATPCTNYVSIFSDVGLTVSIAQPGFKSDAFGNFTFYASTGQQLVYTVSGTGITAPQGPFAISIPVLLPANNAFTGTNTFANSNNVLACDGTKYAQSSAGIAAAIADLPTTGGVIDCRGWRGVQNWTTNPFASLAKPVTLLLGDATFTVTAGISFDLTGVSNFQILGAGIGRTVFKFSNTGAVDGIKTTGNTVVLSGFTVDMQSVGTGNGIHVTGGGAESTFVDLETRNAGGSGFFLDPGTAGIQRYDVSRLVTHNNAGNGFYVNCTVNLVCAATGIVSHLEAYGNTGDGLKLQSLNVGTQVGPLTFIRPRLENNTGNGIDLVSALGVDFVSAEAEGNGGWGVQCDANTSQINFLHLDGAGGASGSINTAVCPAVTAIGGSVFPGVVHAGILRLAGTTSGSVDIGASATGGAAVTKNFENIRFADQFATVQAAINDIPASGGTIYIPPGSYTGPTTIPANTTLRCTTWMGCTFQYTAGLSISPASGSANNITIDGIQFDFQGNNAGITLNSVAFSTFRWLIKNTGTAPALTTGTTIANQTNTSWNNFEYLYVTNAASIWKCAGTFPTQAAGAVTLNHFGTMIGQGITSVGFDFNQGCDTNQFDFMYAGLSAATANGVILNSLAPTTTDHDIQLNHISMLEIDGATSATGKFLVVNTGNNNRIDSFGCGLNCSTSNAMSVDYLHHQIHIGFTTIPGSLGLNSAGQVSNGFTLMSQGSTGNFLWTLQGFPTNFTANRTVNPPDAGGVMVLDTATQTLTNKTLSTGTVFSAGLFNSAGTPQTAWHMVQDVATLSAGAVTVTLAGSAVFTSATTYACIVEDETAANATKCVRNSGSSLTISGTATDVVHFVLIGN